MGVVVSFEKIIVDGQLCDACLCCDVDLGLVYSFGGDLLSVAKGLEPFHPMLARISRVDRTDHSEGWFE